MASSAALHDQLSFEDAAVPAATIAQAPERASIQLPVASSKAALRLRIYFGLVAIDALSLTAGFAAANFFRYGEMLNIAGVNTLVLLLPLYFVLAFNSGAFSIAALMKPKESIKRATTSLVLAVAAIIGTLFYLKSSADFSRVVVAVGSISALVLVGSARWAFGKAVGRRLDWRFTNEVLLIDGVAVFPTRGEIVLFADQAQLHPAIDNPVLLDRLGRLLRNCDRVVLACAAERRGAWSAMMKGLDTNVEVMAPELDEIGALGIGRVGHRSTVIVSRGPLGARDQFAKRLLDLSLTLPTTILLAPLFIIIALAIKIDSPGPIFFRQERMGQGNRIFQILKFRSMRSDVSDHAGRRSATRDDDRVTRMGALLRRTSLDELPQLLNVLKGDMSIVGPRPHALGSTADDLLFWDIDATYWDRHVVKPGITGLAQVRGFRGATAERADLSNRLQADLEYVTNWSVWRDIGIVLATMRVLFHKNAF